MASELMSRDMMDAAIRRVCACHGRSMPAEPLLEEIWDAVPAEADDAFAEYVRQDLSDRADLPRNLPRCIRRELWPAYLASTASGAATGGEIWDGRPGCESCGGRGWHRVWPADAPAGTAPTAIPCVCNARVLIDAEEYGITPTRWSRADLEASGAWRWTDPGMDGVDLASYPRERILAAMQAAAAGEPEKAAPVRHVDPVADIFGDEAGIASAENDAPF